MNAAVESCCPVGSAPNCVGYTMGGLLLLLLLLPLADVAMDEAIDGSHSARLSKEAQ